MKLTLIRHFSRSTRLTEALREDTSKSKSRSYGGNVKTNFGLPPTSRTITSVPQKNFSPLLSCHGQSEEVIPELFEKVADVSKTIIQNMPPNNRSGRRGNDDTLANAIELSNIEA